MAIDSRTKILIPDIDKIGDKVVVVVGIGGVGGTVAEALVRTGVKKIIVIDYDQFIESNLNRQILATKEDIGVDKVSVAKKRLTLLGEKVEVTALKLKINQETIEELNEYQVDFLVDAIDDMNGKILLIEYCLKKNIDFISSLGMGNKYDPTMIEITTLNKTFNDRLAKKLRGILKKRNIDIRKINVVFSKELPSQEKSSILGSLIFPPSSAGLAIAYYAIKSLLK